MFWWAQLRGPSEPTHPTTHATPQVATRRVAERSRRLVAAGGGFAAIGLGLALPGINVDSSPLTGPGFVDQVQRVERASPALHVATAVPKGDRLGTLLDGLGQLAVQSVTPLDCERSVTPADRLSGERPVRILAEAMKQSRGAWLPEVRHPATPEDFAAEIARQLTRFRRATEAANIKIE